MPPSPWGSANPLFPIFIDWGRGGLPCRPAPVGRRGTRDARGERRSIPHHTHSLPKHTPPFLATRADNRFTPPSPAYALFFLLPPCSQHLTDAAPCSEASTTPSQRHACANSGDASRLRKVGRPIWLQKPSLPLFPAVAWVKVKSACFQLLVLTSRERRRVFCRCGPEDVRSIIRVVIHAPPIAICRFDCLAVGTPAHGIELT